MRTSAPQLQSIGYAMALLLLLAQLPGCMSLEVRAGPMMSRGVARVVDVPVVGTAAVSGGRALDGAMSASGRALDSARTSTAVMTVRALDSGPAPHAGFLTEPELLVDLDRERHPFQRVWVSPGLQRERYDRIAVAPITLDHMLENSFWDKLSTATLFGLDDDAQRIGLRLHDRVEQAFHEDPHRRFEVVAVADADERTLILELALVELVPNKSVVALGALAAMAAPPAISAPLGFVASRTEHGFVAIEGRVRDGGTGEVMAMFADRETAKTRVLDLQSIRWYGHAHEIIDDWSLQLVAVANRPESPGIADPTPFTFKPW